MHLAVCSLLCGTILAAAAPQDPIPVRTTDAVGAPMVPSGAAGGRESGAPTGEPVPEPRTLLLVGVGVICLVLSQRWRRQLRRQL